MKRYKVTVDVVHVYTAEIVAETRDEAREIAKYWNDDRLENCREEAVFTAILGTEEMGSHQESLATPRTSD